MVSEASSGGLEGGAQATSDPSTTGRALHTLAIIKLTKGTFNHEVALSLVSAESLSGSTDLDCYGDDMGTTGMTIVLAGLLSSPAPSPATPPAPWFSPGIGYTVSRLQREIDAAEPARVETPPVSLAPHLPPPTSDLARVQASPEARGIQIAAAVAVQLAMVVAGIVAVREQREQVRRERAHQVPPYRPYR